MTEAQKCLHHIAENMRMDKSISKEGYEYFQQAIKALEQESKAGRWIETAEEYYKAVNEYGGGVNENTPYFVDDIACSECLAKYSVIGNEAERFDYCPSCGAKMESEGE